MRDILIKLITLAFLCLSVSSAAAQKIDNAIIISTTEKVDLNLIKSSIESLLPSEDSIVVDFIGLEDFPIYSIQLPVGTINTKDILYALQSEDFTRHVQYDYTLSPRFQIPNDSLLSSQWHLTSVDLGLNMIAGWQYETGGPNINDFVPVIALIDDGYHLDHPDMPNLWVNPGEIADNGIDDDNNGHIDDINGWNFEFDSNEYSLGSHGTSVLGVAASRTNNFEGLASPNWGVEILALQTNFSLSNILQNYVYLYDQRKLFNDSNGNLGAFIAVINHSFGADGLFPEDSPIWCEFFDELGEEGIISTVAVSNGYGNIDLEGDLPSLCSSEFMVTVGGIDQYGQLHSGYSLENVDIVAGAKEIMTFSSTELYANCDGTSFAAPQIAGLLSMLYSSSCDYIATELFESPATIAKELIQHLTSSITPIPGLNNLIQFGGSPDSELMLSNFDEFCDGCHPVHNINYWMENDELHINWSNSLSTEEVILHWRKQGAIDWNSLSLNSGNSCFVSNLPPCEDWEFYFYSLCAQEEFNTQVFGFNTENCCVPLSTATSNQASVSTLAIEINPFEYNYSYTLEYKPLIDNSIWESVDTVEAVTILNNIRPCTEYTFRLTSVCPISGNTEQIEFNRFTDGCELCTFDYEYCDGTGYNNYEFIQEVHLNGMTNISGSEIDGYNLFNHFSLEPLYKDETNSISIIPESTILNSINAIYSIWIDYNQNGDFDNNEEVLSIPSSNEDGITTDFVIPSSALSGYTRMRIKLTWWEYDGQESQACQEFFYGETEDYCILIGDTNSTECTAVEEIDIYYNPFAQSFDIEIINPDTSISLYGIYHKLATENDWYLQFSNLPFFSLEGYEEDDIIEVQFQSYCSNTPGPFSDVFSTSISSHASSLSSDAVLQVHPNPTQDFIIIEGLENQDQIRLNVYDQNGLSVLSELLTENNKQDKFRLDLRSLPPGVYILEVSTERNSTTKKIIKL